MLALMWAMTSLLKHFMMTEVSVTSVFLWHWDDGLLKAGGHYSLGQGQFEDVRKDARQLVSTHSEDAAKDA